MEIYRHLRWLRYGSWEIALSSKGSAGGHNGVKSIIAETGTRSDRIKIGIGRPQKGMTVVNSNFWKFSEDDYATILLDFVTMVWGDSSPQSLPETNDFEDTMRVGW